MEEIEFDKIITSQHTKTKTKRYESKILKVYRALKNGPLPQYC